MCTVLFTTFIMTTIVGHVTLLLNELTGLKKEGIGGKVTGPALPGDAGGFSKKGDAVFAAF